MHPHIQNTSSVTEVMSDASESQNLGPQREICSALCTPIQKRHCRFRTPVMSERYATAVYEGFGHLGIVTAALTQSDVALCPVNNYCCLTEDCHPEKLSCR